MIHLYGAIRIPHLAAQSAVRLRPQLAATPLAVLEGTRPHERLCSANTTALALGLTPGMSRVEVESFAVQILPRVRAEEQSAVSILLEAASLFTPRTEAVSTGTPDWECLLDLTGSERLLGTPEDLGRKILAHLATLNFNASIALCENPDAALSLARAAIRPVTAIAYGGLKRSLAPLPLSVLNLSGDDQERFASWGVHTLGELAELPERDLITRLGQSGKRLLQRARGELPYLLQPAEVAFDLSEALDFDDPIETLEPLLFCINPMLEQLLLRAQSRTLALAAVTITLTLYRPADRALGESPEIAPGEIFTRTIRPAMPTVDRPLLLKMLQLDLESNPPSGAIVRLHLAAEPGPTSRIQLGLFAPPMPEPTRFEDTHARLIALVGETNVGRLLPLDTHAVESFILTRFKLPTSLSAQAPARPPSSNPASALRRLRPPAPVHVVLGLGTSIRALHFESRRFEVLRAFGPWRSSGNWWNPTPWSTDTWDLALRCQAEDEEVLLCIVAHDLLADRWHLEAIYD
jgi:protein ImuB